MERVALPRTIDIDNRVQEEASLGLWLASNPAPCDVKARLVIGHMIAARSERAAGAVNETLQIEHEMLKVRASKLEDELQFASERARKLIDEELSATRARLEQQYSALSTRTSDAADAQRALVAMVERLDARDAELRTHVSSLYATELERAKEALAASHAECALLRNSNHVKGNMGEAAVMASLKNSPAFADWSFVDTSGIGAESDFHMISAGGEHVVAVEVKNKSIVKAADVDKAMRDVRELQERYGDRLVAYVFVSLRSCNIPRKGGLALDAAPGSEVPMLWMGMAAEEGDGLTSFARTVKVVVDAACILQRHRKDTSTMVECEKAKHAAVTLIDKVGGHLQRLDGMRRALLNMQDAANSIRRNSDSMSAALDVAYREMEEGMITAAGHVFGADGGGMAVSAAPPPPPPRHACDTCGRHLLPRAVARTI